MTEYTDTAMEAVEKPLDPENAALMYGLGVSNCGCCALVGQEELDTFNNWFQEEIRKAKEEAWEEGWDKGFDVAAEAYQYGRMDASGDNPYRKEQND